MKKSQTELGVRVQTGVILTVIGAIILSLSGYTYTLNAVAAVLSILGISELLRAVDQYSDFKMLALSLMSTIICFWDIPHYHTVLLITWILAVIVFFALMRHVSKLHFCSFLSILPCTLALPLFLRGMAVIRQRPHGLYILIVVTLGCVINDIAAYFVGKAIGSHKLAPVISPGKTWEGSIGGMVCSVIMLMILSWFYAHCAGVRIRYGLLLLYLLLASLIGQFGDLSMSTIKRSVGIKDFGRILPGHGGILDRFDSLLFVIPFAVIFFRMTGVFVG